MVYAVVDAQGWYGDYTRVYATFASLAEADAYASRGRYAVIAAERSFAAGERVHRLEAERYGRCASGEREQ